MTRSRWTQEVSLVIALSTAALAGCPTPKTQCASSADCAAGQTCTAGVCTTPAACTKGQTKCVGQSLMECSSAGAFTLETLCPGACTNGACASATCQPGTVQCAADGMTLETCNTSGTAYSPTTVCATGCSTTTNACNAETCKPGATQCSTTGELQTCNATGTGFTTTSCAPDGGSATCVDNGQSGTATAAWCEELQCTPNAVRCSGLQIVECNSTGTGETQVTTCPQACSNGQCVNAVCEPGTMQCASDGITLQTCNQLGTGYNTTSCMGDGGTGICVATGAPGTNGPHCGLCQPNQSTCQGDNLLQCSSDGLQEMSVQACADGCLADAGMCQGMVCSPGQQQCDADGKTIEVCAANGGSYIPTQVCQLGCNATTNACNPQVCQPGATQCSSGSLQTCALNGSGWTTTECVAADGGQETCVTNGLSGNTGTAFCEQLACTPGAVRCEGVSVVQCNASGMGETPISVCSGTCNNGQCANSTCSPGSEQCSSDGSEIEVCNQLGTGYSSMPCSSDGGMGVCVAVAGVTGPGSAHCELTICTPNSKWCDGTQVVECSSDGLTETPMQACPYGCSNGACQQAACVPGQEQCNGNTLEECAPNQQGYLPQQYCLAGCVISASGAASCAAQVCSPFNSRCADNDTAVETCMANGSGYTTSPCPSMMTCAMGSCVAQQPSCSSGATQCNGANVQTCETSDAGTVGWTTTGGCLGTCSNGACDSAGSCGPFGLFIALATSGASLPGDGQSTFLVISDPILGSDGSATPDGTLVTVAVSGAQPPALLSADRDPTTPGLQVPVINDRIQFLIQAPAVALGTVTDSVIAQIGAASGCQANLPVTFDPTVTDRFVGDDFSTVRERDPAATTATWNTAEEAVSLTSFDSGDGRDGPLVVGAGQTVDLSVLQSNGHSFADMAAVAVASISGTTVTVNGSTAAFTQPGTRVMLVNLQAASGSASAVGTWETGVVAGTSASGIDLVQAPAKVYSPVDNTASSLATQAVVLVRMPQYSSVQVAAGGTLTGPAFNGATGGVLAFLAQSFSSAGDGGNSIAGTITMQGKGYRGGGAPAAIAESTCSEVTTDNGLGTRTLLETGDAGVYGMEPDSDAGLTVAGSLADGGVYYHLPDGGLSYVHPQPNVAEEEQSLPPYHVYGSYTGEGPLGSEYNIPLSTAAGIGGGGGGYDCGTGDIVAAKLPSNACISGGSTCGTGDVAAGSMLPSDTVTYAYWGSGGSFTSAGNSTCSGAGTTYGDPTLGTIFMGGGSGTVSQSTAHSCDMSRYCCRGNAGTSEAGACMKSVADTTACTMTPYCDAHSYPWSSAYAGQTGGGIIYITAGALTFTGSGNINGAGVNATAGNFGSAGGSIYVRASSVTLGKTGVISAAGGAGGGQGAVRIDAASIDPGFTANWTTPPADYVQLQPSIAQSLVELTLPMGYTQATGTLVPVGVSLPTIGGLLDPIGSYAATGLTLSLSEDGDMTWDAVNSTAQASFGGSAALGTSVKWQISALGESGSAHAIAAHFTP